MHLYMSGTPSNDHYQVIENQMCTHRLLSMHGDYQGQVMKWLDLVKSGVRTFDDYCNSKPNFKRFLTHQDNVMRRTLAEHGVSDKWIPYAEMLGALSAKYQPTIPRHIMLDSGAFTAWNAGKTVTLDDLTRAYEQFLTAADSLFDEVWLINLDVIPGTKDVTPTPLDIRDAIQMSDRNLSALRSKFGDCVMPVFHQGEGQARLLEVVDQAKGYLCLSPANNRPEDERWRWTKLARVALSDLDCDVHTHGLATTGNDMMRQASLYSADSFSWKLHGTYGTVDLVREATKPVEHVKISFDTDSPIRTSWIGEFKELRYLGYHIARERHDYDRKAKTILLDNDRHYSRLPKEEQDWVRSRVEMYVPLLFAQFDAEARALVNLGELKAFAESILWDPPGIQTLINDVPAEKGSPHYYELRPYPLESDRSRFLAERIFGFL